MWGCYGSCRPQVGRIPVKPGRGVPTQRGAWARRLSACEEAVNRVWEASLGWGATQGAQRFWHGEGEQAGRSGQLCIEWVVQPLPGLMMLTLWTVPMATGMSDVVLLLPTLAGREALAVGARAASAAGVNRLVVRGREVRIALARL
jgi:hypothetical protein